MEGFVSGYAANERAVLHIASLWKTSLSLKAPAQTMTKVGRGIFGKEQCPSIGALLACRSCGSSCLAVPLQLHCPPSFDTMASTSDDQAPLPEKDIWSKSEASFTSYALLEVFPAIFITDWTLSGSEIQNTSIHVRTLRKPASSV